MSIDNKKVLAVITARGGSTGIPGKNIKLLGGKPLLAWSIESAKQAKTIDKLILSTDAEDIAAVGREHGIEVPFMRPAELAQSETPHLPVMQHALLEMERRNDERYDIAVIIQPTSPFRPPQYIDDVVEALAASSADSAVSVYQVNTDYHPTKMKVFDEQGHLVPYCSCAAERQGTRRQDMTPVYKRSSHVYAMTRECLLDKQALYGDVTIATIVPDDWVIDIDEPRDWDQAEQLVKPWLERKL